jgi:FdhD protein
MVVEENAVALVYDGATYAVMMATPSDLEDFAIGFSLTEAIITQPGDISSLEIATSDLGIELRMWLVPKQAAAYHRRRRKLLGATGCGLCGIESLAEAVRTCPRIEGNESFPVNAVADAVEELGRHQALHHLTRATHAAGYYVPERGLLTLREDVGRHNALDKLAGAIARYRLFARQGALVISSRVSVEMVQKAGMIGAPLLIAVSAPTAMAVRTASEANITLVAVARGASFEVFTRPDRIV